VLVLGDTPAYLNYASCIGDAGVIGVQVAANKTPNQNTHTVKVEAMVWGSAHAIAAGVGVAGGSRKA
jgi:hypothetical protein